MSASNLPNLPSFRKQHLFLEFASLKLRCPAGIYLTLDSSDPSQWSGVLFVRSGPYSPAILRFGISFPSSYPELPPLVSFATDIFHPLLVPLTTYTFSTGANDAGEPVSASDEERLPPGGFNLRDGFPRWFGREQRRGRATDTDTPLPFDSVQGERGGSSQPSIDAAAKPLSMVDVLGYIKSTFEDAAMLDRLPLEAAGNPGAWHAWRTHRGLSKAPSRAASPTNGERSSSPTKDPQPRPGDWNWEGVWESRVRRGMESSLSHSVLFAPKGGRGSDKRSEMIRFSKIEDEHLEEIRQQILEAHDGSQKA